LLLSRPSLGLAKAALAGAVSLLFLCASSGCKPDPASDSSGSFPRAETLYVGGRQWGEPSSFNPLISSPDWPVNGTNLLYEYLLLYDPQSGKMQPLLAESFEVRQDEIEVVINAAARWSDGKPVTGADVKYTYDLGQKYKGVPHAPIWKYITEVKLPDEGKAPYPRHVVFALDKQRNNPLVVLDSLTETRIIPRHVVEPMLAQVNGDINEFDKLKFDRQPVVSGPYQLLSYSSEKIVLVRNENYWGNQALHAGKLPAPKYLVHPIYKSNDHFSVGLQQGRIDASSSFIPRIWLKKRKGVRSWFDKEPFFAASSIPMLFVNVTHKPLDDVKMRRAMAFAINYSDINELAVSGYSGPLKPGIILPFGLESKYYSAEDAQKYGTTFDPERAKATLKEAGYTAVWGADGQLVETHDAKGNKVPTVYIQSPTGWSDWESIVRIAVRSMRDVGIDAREKFIDASLYWSALPNGDFDLIMSTPSPNPAPSKPWSRFETLLTAKEWAPQGEKMFKNQGRFNNPKSPDYVPRFEELLDRIPTLTDEHELADAYRELNRLFMQYQPSIPLEYRPDQFYEVSTRHWDNFPTSDNPYTPPQIPGDRLGTLMLWQLKAVER
jgi:peptide/nickel transport system substrate-binding protein